MPPTAKTSENLVLLDACCLLNLFATGRAEEILGALPYTFAIARYVAEKEVLEIEPEEGEGPQGSGTVALRPSIVGMIERGLIRRLEIATHEEELALIRFAAQLDDGEAHTLALALVRESQVATDDRKAIRVAKEAWSEAAAAVGDAGPCIRTSELLFEWAEGENLGDDELRRIVGAITRRARFLPPRVDPWFERWMELLQGNLR